MTRNSPTLVRGAFALVPALVLSLGAMTWAPTARAQEDAGAGTNVTGAEFRWGVNAESRAVGHAPGTFNFLYAGDVSTHLTGPNMTISEGQWSAKAGDVSIQKCASDGSLATASWADTQTDPSGADLEQGEHSGLEMLFTNGEGTVDAGAGTAEISWDGTSSIVYYSGYVYMTISDPELTVTSSSATITAEMGGHETDRSDASKWDPISPRRVTIADLPRDEVELGGDKGFAVTPSYLGVEYSAPADASPQVRDGDSWGSFPESFVNFANDTGSGPFWYTSGGIGDGKKPPQQLSIGWDAGDSSGLLGECDSSTSGSSSDGVLGQVIDDTVEDILRAAGTDVSDTAEAWMDEAWKPLQPEAVNSAQGAQGVGGEPAGAGAETGEAGERTGGETEDEEFSAHHGEQYSADAPMTAGTVGAAVATSPATSGSGSAGGSRETAPASAPVTDQGTIPVAANLPLTDVVYSDTSASSEAGNALPQWQWWVGGILLALAAGLFYKTAIRKD